MLPSLATTVPLGLLWAQPAIASVVVTVACVLSLLIFHTMTIAGMIVALVLLYRLGRHGAPQLLAVGLATPFLPLALLGQAHPSGPVLLRVARLAWPGDGLDRDRAPGSMMRRARLASATMTPSIADEAVMLWCRPAREPRRKLTSGVVRILGRVHSLTMVTTSLLQNPLGRL